jgi:hypothetical protein
MEVEKHVYSLTVPDDVPPQSNYCVEFIGPSDRDKQMELAIFLNVKKRN